MDSVSVIKQFNKDRVKIEACFVMSLWCEPELYEEYLKLNENGDETLRDKDAQFYFKLGKMMYKQGFRDFDHVTLETYLSTQPRAKKKFEEYGGYNEVKQLMNLIDSTNVNGYFDQIRKINMLSEICLQYTNAFENPSKFDELTSEEVYNYFEHINSQSSIAAGNSEQVEELTVDNDFVARLEAGEEQGISYWKYCPRLNNITLGAKPGSLYMVGALSGSGKTSWAFECMLMGAHYEGTKVAVISNEMTSQDYKILLLQHVLITELRYYGITRKGIRAGNYTDEQKQKIKEAQEIIKEKYNDVYFIKMFDNNIEKVLKYLRKLKAMGVSLVMYDTFKSDDRAGADILWQSLMLDARKLFQCVSRLGICCVTTYQLALHTENTRYLTANCLSNSKQIKEIYETMIYMRSLWDDERKGGKYYIHPYYFDQYNKKVKHEYEFDDDGKYMLVFVDKNRADEDKQVLVYKWKANWNEWKEVAYAKVINDHGMGVQKK